jgi:hypothetical protein
MANVMLTNVAWAGEKIAYTVGTFRADEFSTEFCGEEKARRTYIVDADGANRRLIGQGVIVAGSDDAQSLLVRTDQGLAVVDVNSGRATVVVRSIGNSNVAADWTEGNAHVAFETGSKLTLMTIDRKARVVERVTHPGSETLDLHWRRAGGLGPLRLVAGCGRDGRHVYGETAIYDTHGKVIDRLRFIKPANGRVGSEDIAL